MKVKRLRRMVGQCFEHHAAVLNVILMHATRIALWQKLDVSSQSSITEAVIALMHLNASQYLPD